MLQKILPKQRDASERELSREAKYFADLLSRKLEQLNVCYRYKRNEKDWMERGTQRVKFSLAVVDPDALWLKIDTSPRQFPRGISLANIDNPDVLGDLSVSAARPVHFRRSEDGAWLMVERQAGVFGIKQIDFADIIEQWPTNEKPLQLPMGLTHNRKLIYRSLADFPHALIGGATMSGKTTLMHAWICALILKNSPHALKLVLIDLKGGVEFTRYKDLPHLWMYQKEDGTTLGGFVKNRDNVIPVLDLLRWEMDRRLAMFESAGGQQNIIAWNHYHRKNPLFRIVVFIDELASLMLEPDLKKDAERDLADIGARGRAPGIHLVVATQRPEVSVVSGRIKGNLDARCGFRVPDMQSSMVILDDASASKFPESTPRGRYVYKLGNDRKELQGPWIGPNKIKAIVESVITGDYEMQVEAAKIDPLEIFRVALAEFRGETPVKKLHSLMRGRVSENYLVKLLRDYEGQVIDIDGKLYELINPPGQFTARRLVPLSETEDRDNDSATDSVPPSLVPQTAIVLHSDMPQTKSVQEDDLTRPETWLLWAVKHNNGFMPVKKLYRQFSKGCKLNYSEMVAILAEYDSTTIELDGVMYFCEPGNNKKPRRLVEVN